MSNSNNSNRGHNSSIDDNTEAAQSADDDRRGSHGADTSPREQIHVNVEDLQPAAVPGLALFI